MNGQDKPHAGAFKAFCFWTTAVIMVVVAAALRWRGAHNDLWLDEVWSLQLVGKIHGAWQVFTQIHLDNNHYLNSLWLYWLGPHRAPVLYRLPSIVTGVGTVMVAGLIGLRRNRATGLIAMYLTAFSYVLVLYSSEARGYGEVVFFSFLCFYLLDRYWDRPSWRLAAAYSASALLGFASHLVFLNTLLALMAWFVARQRFSRQFFFLHAVPVLFFAWLYLIDVRQMIEGGGTYESSLFAAFASAIGWGTGMPLPHEKILPTFLIGVVILVVGWQRLRQEKSREYIFFAGVIFIFPLLLAVIRNSEVIYIRYFILSMAFLLILASYVLGDFFEENLGGKAGDAAFLMVFLVINGFHIGELFRDGRGHYNEAIKYMAAHTRGSVITIDSDNDFQVPLMLDYYADATGGKPVEYRLKKSGPWGAEWLVVQKDSLEDASPPHAREVVSGGVPYALVANFQTAPLSGLRWFIYERENRSSATNK